MYMLANILACKPTVSVVVWLCRNTEIYYLIIQYEAGLCREEGHGFCFITIQETGSMNVPLNKHPKKIMRKPSR